MFQQGVCQTTFKRGFIWQIYPLNKKIFDVGEFLFSSVNERPYSWVKEPASGPSSIKDSNEEGTSAGFIGSISVH
jgi:hypothetical protein